MKLTGVILFASVAAASTVLKRQGNNNNNGTIQNPFAGLPNLSSYGFCTTECQTIFEIQKNPPSDWTTTCTPTFAAGVQSCLNCISTSIPALLLTDDIKKSISTTLEIYQKNCVVLASTTEPVTLPTALAATGTQSGGTTGTASSAPASTTSGAAANLKIQTPGVPLAVALVVALAAF